MTDKVAILVVDDHPLFRQGVVNVFSVEPDFEVVGQTDNGEAALTMIRQLQPEIAVLDVNLPDMNGQQVMRQVVAEKLPTRVILLTAYDDESQMAYAMRGGAAAYCSKDIRPETLVWVIRQVRQGKHVLGEQIAVVGHSDGGLTATAFGYGQQFRDMRVVAVASLTGGIGLFPGAFLTGSELPAVLAVHARDDGTNPYSASTSLFRSVPPGRPRFLLTIEKGDHIEPYMFGTGRVEIGDAIAAFLDLSMANDPAARDRLQHAAAAPGLSLESAA